MILNLKSIAGKIGGQSRIQIHGNPGTQKGRILGGLRSIEIQKRKIDSPFKRKSIRLPVNSKLLAEFIGIVLGDGGITKRQVTITFDKKTDAEYTKYVVSICKQLFEIPVFGRDRPNTNVKIIVLSRSNLIDFLLRMGIESGSKVKNQVGVPKWIGNNNEFSYACIRGLFDTDGCFYTDKHIINGKLYINPGMNFTNRSLPLLTFFKKNLLNNGFKVTQISPYSIVLRKEKDIIRYFSEVGSSNPKHVKKLKLYLKNKRGRVPKWS